MAQEDSTFQIMNNPFADNQNDNDDEESETLQETVSDGMIAITFSTWQEDAFAKNTSRMDNPEDVILQALEDFFCEDTELILVNRNYKNICSKGGTELSSIGSGTLDSDNNPAVSARTSISDFLADSKEEKSYLSNEIVFFVVSPVEKQASGNDGTAIQWKTWTVVYQVVYIGTTLVDQAAMSNAPNEEDFLEDVVQLALDVSIMEGIMDTRIDGTGIVMSMVGLETETFGDNQDTTVDPIEQEVVPRNGDILRWIGAGLFLTNVLIVLILTRIAKRQRLYREEEDALLDEQAEKQRQRGSGTEKEVDFMLDVGWKDSSYRFSEPNQSKTSTGKTGNLEQVDLAHKPASGPQPSDNDASKDSPQRSSDMMQLLNGLMAATSGYFASSSDSRG
jgi:hypothetical protein